MESSTWKEEEKGRGREEQKEGWRVGKGRERGRERARQQLYPSQEIAAIFPMHQMYQIVPLTSFSMSMSLMGLLISPNSHCKMPELPQLMEPGVKYQVSFLGSKGPLFLCLCQHFATSWLALKCTFSLSCDLLCPGLLFRIAFLNALNQIDRIT